jgi:ABC-2 type transport system permease protein
MRAVTHAPLWLLMRTSLVSSLRRVMALREQSRLLTLFVFLFVGTYLVLSYRLFAYAFHFINRFPGVGGLLTEPLMYLLFAFLFILLLISNLIIGYSNLFRNREAAFLLTQPVRFETIFQWKLLESSILASWAFLFLIAPLIIAFGHSKNVAWHFYPAAVCLVALFIVLPGVAGCAGAVVVARYLHRRVFQVLCLVLMLGIVGLAIAWYHSGQVSEESGGRMFAVMERMLNRTKFAQYPLLPSYWLTSAVLQWAEGAIAVACFYLLVLLSNALFFSTVVCTRLGDFFYAAASTTQSRPSIFGTWAWVRALAERKAESPFAVSLAERMLARVPGLAGDVRALIVKDGRMFWRDTTQWVQTLMLFGLLAVYVFNIRYFSEQLSTRFWIHLVAFLNLGACALNLATLTTRFVFPQFSLEGKRLWIVGMAPLGLVQVVRVKFWVASVLSLGLTLSLILVSCSFLGLDFETTAKLCTAMCIMTFTLNAMAVGLGTLYPNFREDNPGKIVSGFGGTLCLILSFMYILGSVVMLALTVTWRMSAPPTALRVNLLLAGFAVASLLLGWLPFHLGLRRLRHFEL